MAIAPLVSGRQLKRKFGSHRRLNLFKLASISYGSFGTDCLFLCSYIVWYHQAIFTREQKNVHCFDRSSRTSKKAATASNQPRDNTSTVYGETSTMEEVCPGIYINEVGAVIDSAD